MYNFQGVKMKLTPWLVLIALTTVACSGSKSAQKVEEETPQIELSSTDDFAENPSEENAVEDTTTEDTPSESTENTEEVVINNNEPLVQESSLENPAPAISSGGGSEKQYTVQKNETLMMIAFKIYGDYRRWKEIANINTGSLNGNSTVKSGMVLNYIAPSEEFVWNPQGNPYLIKTGDTLGTISKQVYTTKSKWKLLWENNRPLIKDPNKIYAGFTIYYLESSREVANQL
jgi:nucleoid-associated protein YgaU